MLSLDFAFRVRQNYYHQNMAKLKNEKEYRPHNKSKTKH